MEEFNPIFTHLVNESDEFTADLFRYCLSDQLGISLDAVLDDRLNPITYAVHAEKLVGNRIIDHFHITPSLLKSCPAEIKQMWTYDHLVGVASMYRLAKLFEKDSARYQKLFWLACIYPLNIYDKSLPVTQFGGLSFHAVYVRSYMKTNPQAFQNTNAIIYKQFLDQIASYDEMNWVFWDKKWQSILSSPTQLQCFRKFLYAAFCSFIQEPVSYTDCFYITHDDVATLMYDFVELRKDSTIKQADVTAFIKRLRFYFEEETQNPSFALLLEGPFSYVDMYYKECGENPHKFQQMMMNQHIQNTNE